MSVPSWLESLRARGFGRSCTWFDHGEQEDEIYAAQFALRTNHDVDEEHDDPLDGRVPVCSGPPVFVRHEPVRPVVWASVATQQLFLSLTNEGHPRHWLPVAPDGLDALLASYRPGQPNAQTTRWFLGTTDSLRDVENLWAMSWWVNNVDSIGTLAAGRARFDTHGITEATAWSAFSGSLLRLQWVRYDPEANAHPLFLEIEHPVGSVPVDVVALFSEHLSFLCVDVDALEAHLGEWGTWWLIFAMAYMSEDVPALFARLVRHELPLVRAGVADAAYRLSCLELVADALSDDPDPDVRADYAVLASAARLHG